MYSATHKLLGLGLLAGVLLAPACHKADVAVPASVAQPTRALTGAERNTVGSANDFAFRAFETLRAQSRTYTDTASQQVEDAQRYASERIRERPITATLAGLGVGVLIGLLLSGGRSNNR